MKILIASIILIAHILAHSASASSDVFSIVLEYSLTYNKHLFKVNEDTYCFLHALKHGPYPGDGYQLTGKSKGLKFFKPWEYYCVVVQKSSMVRAEYLNMIFHDPFNRLEYIKYDSDVIIEVRKEEYTSITGTLYYIKQGIGATYKQKISYRNATVYTVLSVK